jgi:hypothetical protein
MTNLTCQECIDAALFHVELRASVLLLIISTQEATIHTCRPELEERMIRRAIQLEQRRFALATDKNGRP